MIDNATINAFCKAIRPYIREFEAVQSRWSKFGAVDSEPCSTFAQYVVDVSSKERSIDDLPSLEEWELFDREYDVTKAVDDLNKSARRVAEEVCKYDKASEKVADSGYFKRICGYHDSQGNPAGAYRMRVYPFSDWLARLSVSLCWPILSRCGYERVKVYREDRLYSDGSIGLAIGIPNGSYMYSSKDEEYVPCF